jgi:hypothetical protein
LATQGAGRGRTGAVLFVLAGLLLATSTYLCFGPLPARFAGGRTLCPAGLGTLSLLRPSTVPAGSDPRYARSRACRDAIVDATPYGLALMVAGAVTLVVWSRRPLTPR